MAGSNTPAIPRPVNRSCGTIWLGAWRSTHERPLEWDRPTLLRRMGPSMEDFSDARATAAKLPRTSVSRVMRCARCASIRSPPPPLLAETIRAFKADRQASQLIDRDPAPATGLVSAYWRLSYRWLWNCWTGPSTKWWKSSRGWNTGASQRCGSAAALNSVKPDQDHLSAEVRAGKLPETVLQALDELQIERLLGARSARKARIACGCSRTAWPITGWSRKKSLFDRLLAGQQTPMPIFNDCSEVSLHAVAGGRAARDRPLRVVMSLQDDPHRSAWVAPSAQLYGKIVRSVRARPSGTTR